jgi:two-component system OmpR family response regulator
MRVLIVEDERQVARQISAKLSRAGYVVEVAHDGREGLYMGENMPYDLVVLDLGLPVMDGLSVLREWRGSGRCMPVLILTARDSWREKVEGLRAGADDYLAKPFELEEMQARLEALIRRAAGRASPALECGALRLDTATMNVNLAGVQIDLTGYEYKALAYLMHQQPKVVSKTELTEHLYDQDFDRDSNVIEVLVNRLRKKLGARFIKTHRGKGYQLVGSEDDDQQS